MSKLPKQNIIEHLLELKNLILTTSICFVAVTAVSYYFADYIFYLLVQPLLDLDNSKKLIYTGLSEAFFTYLRLSFFSSFVIIFPFTLWQIYIFIAPGLYKNERQLIMPYLVATPILFWLGILFAYYIIFPMAWKFFINFEYSSHINISLEAKISEYLGLAIHLMIAFGLAFEFPVLLMILLKSELISLEQMITKRKYVIILIFVIAAIITPPDVTSQVALAIPMLLLYEMVILYGKITRRKKC